MKALRRLLGPALVAGLLCACGISPVNDHGGNMELAAAGNAQVKATGSAQSSGAQDGAALQKAAQALTAIADPKSKAYKIGPLDVLEITVFRVPDLSKSVQVSEAGTINFPLIGEMQAGGKSARELEQELTKRLGVKYLQNPQITVLVKEYNSQRITVSGAVKKPGVVPMAGGMSLQQAIAISGGLDDNAETTAVVFRNANANRLAGRYDLSEIQAGRADDPQLQSGDVIIVPTSDLKQGFNTVLKVIPLATLAPYL
ncbi:MAG: polysaccharide biosynthesis/export family protein [Rhodomicrobium sp.]